MSDLVLQQLANGVSIGMIYALVALGLTIVFGVLHVINFAHGELYMIGALSSVLLTGTLGVPYLVSVPLAALVAAAVAAVADRIAVAPVLSQPEGGSMVLITTYAVGLLLHESVVAGFGPGPLASAGIDAGVVSLGPVAISAQRVLVIALGVLLVIGLESMLRASRFGRSVRAVSQSAFAAQVVGINVRRIGTLSFCLAGALAGMSGALIVPIASYSAAMGQHAVINAFVIVVIGTMGSVTGAVVCGIALGIVESLASILMPTEIARAIVFSILLVTLLVRPRGLFAR